MKSLLLYSMAAWALLCLVTPLRLHAQDELIANPSFEHALDSWTPMSLEGAVAQFDVKDIDGGKKALCITVPAAAEKRYYVQLDQTLTASMSMGKTYTLSFRAKATPAAQIVITMGDKGPPGAELWRLDQIAITDSWQTYSFPVNVSQDAVQPILNISGLAAAAGQYWFTDISLKEAPAAATTNAPAAASSTPPAKSAGTP